MYTWPLASSQEARLWLDEFAISCGREDAKMLSGDFNVPEYADVLVNRILEQSEDVTDDSEEFRARFVGAYTHTFLNERMRSMKEREEYGNS